MAAERLAERLAAVELRDEGDEQREAGDDLVHHFYQELVVEHALVHLLGEQLLHHLDHDLLQEEGQDLLHHSFGVVTGRRH